ncbi:thioredoxin-like protein 4A isoform X2 [Oncorhynchus tshawytscha]|uniref:thioredoxin-like protein 4A isoform X2 n=1 Tax=Oncorhynchus tshawytscha TaxID=74940 RepID=UPI001C3E6967|nr:thioredoxin-like protein 4A isoform X2 [Oncorhynchus tshawytscha]XP_042166382.1 thioredoxin-like protein 4A isoform X2 [Oncorhynchus tshawytscha]XP_042166384.1 thioredoxin-like protein 4A isoform X2 [Oncorhynchus tshawytscha]XP_042166385.1 thioredoxin-like protein 4A isoform X2 [Oncorhynchus tshawytscha]
MSYMLPHLHNGWQVDQAILSEEDRALVIRNKHIMIDLGTGNNNKINWTMEDKQEMIDIVETVYRGARKGRGLVVSPKDYSTKYRY